MSGEGELGGSMAINKSKSCRGRGSARLARGLTACGLALATELAVAAWELNLQPPVSAGARLAYDLHTMVMWLIVVIFVGVFGVLSYSLYAHRKSKGHKAADFHDNTTVEILWTVVPLIILVL